MTDYASLSAVKQALKNQDPADDALLMVLITRASRTIDRYCAGRLGCDDYFVQETLTDVCLPGRIAPSGRLYCWPCKPIVTSLNALAYRWSPREDWTMLEPGYADINGYTIQYDGINGCGNAQVKISFIGGFSTLPDDLVEATILLSLRSYKESSTGFADSIGVAELGTLTYTKALPAKLIEILKPYKRVTP